MSLSLRFFGGARIETEDGVVTGPASQRHRLALLALLARSHPGGIARDRLLSYLWPESGDGNARNLLNQAVHAIRMTLGSNAVISEGDELRLDPRLLMCDVIDFEEALAVNDMERAADLYAGPFIEGLFLPDAVEFERWTDVERGYLENEYHKALKGLAEAAEDRNDLQSAMDGWRRLANEQRYNAAVTIRLMEILEATGDRAEAIRQARVHVDLMREEFDAAPHPEVVSLAERMRSNPDVASPLTSSRNVSPTDDASLHEGSHARLRYASPHRGRTENGDKVQPLSSGDSPADDEDRSGPPVRFRRPRVFAVLAGISLCGLVGLFLFVRGEGSAASDPTQKKPSVAVLPFVNMSPEANNEFFSDGITEELISTLGKIEGLHVPARTSAFVFKGAAIDVREVGARLGVDHVLEGSVRKDGDRLKIATQLIDVETGFHIWSETYDRDMKDVFEIQEDLARNIANALVGQLHADVAFLHSSSPTLDADAYVSYLKGLHFWNQRSREGLLKAEGYFKQAIRKDSTFALAYAGLAQTYVPMTSLGLFPAEQYIEKIRGSALNALRLDDSLAEAHLALAGYFSFVWDWDAAERESLLALELNPNYANAFHWYGWFLEITKRQGENLRARERAHELDPLSPMISTSYAYARLLSGQYDEAIELCRSALELDPDLWLAYSALGQAYWGKGRITEAVESHERALELSGGADTALSEMAHSYALADRMPEARRMLQELKIPATNRALPYFDIALVHISLGERDEGLRWLQEAYLHRTVRLVYILTEPRLDPIRDDPRYHAILSQMGLNRFEHG